MRLLRVHCAVLNARTSILVRTCSQSYGGHGERETPGHIPNPEAKPLSADGTALETGWESRTPPDKHSKGPSIRAGALRHSRRMALRTGSAGDGQTFGWAAKNRQMLAVASRSGDGGSAAERTCSEPGHWWPAPSTVT